LVPARPALATISRDGSKNTVADDIENFQFPVSKQSQTKAAPAADVLPHRLRPPQFKSNQKQRFLQPIETTAKLNALANADLFQPQSNTNAGNPNAFHYNLDQNNSLASIQEMDNNTGLEDNRVAPAKEQLKKKLNSVKATGYQQSKLFGTSSHSLRLFL